LVAAGAIIAKRAWHVWRKADRVAGANFRT
jgi:hypothetical protein